MDYPLNFAEQLAQHLKSFRKARNLTQAQLALKLGVTQSRIAGIEAQPGKVSLDNLLRILAAVDVRMLLSDRALNADTALKSLKGLTFAERKKNDNQPNLNESDW